MARRGSLTKIYLWRGHPWNLKVGAVVNSNSEVGILSAAALSILISNSDMLMASTNSVVV